MLYTNNAISADPLSSSFYMTSDNLAVYFNKANNTAAFWKFNLTSNSGYSYSILSGCKLKFCDFSKTKFNLIITYLSEEFLLFQFTYS